MYEHLNPVIVYRYFHAETKVLTIVDTKIESVSQLKKFDTEKIDMIVSVHQMVSQLSVINEQQKEVLK